MDEVGGGNVECDLFYWLAGPPYMRRPSQQWNKELFPRGLIWKETWEVSEIS